MRYGINLKNLFYLGRWIDNVLDTDFWSHWNEPTVIKRVTKQYCNGDRLSIDGHFYYSQKVQDMVSHESFRMAQNSKLDYFNNYQAAATEMVKRLKEARFALMRKNRFTPADLQKFFDEFLPLFSFWMIMFPISEGLEKSIHLRLLAHGISLDDIRPYFKSAKDTEIVKQHKAMQKIVTEMRKRGAIGILKRKSVKSFLAGLQRKCPEIHKKIVEHYRRYQWVGVHHFWGSPMTYGKLIGELRTEAKKRSSMSPKTKKINLPCEIVKLVNLMNMLAYWRFRCAELSGYFVYGLWPQLHDIAKRLGVSYDDLYWFNRDEIITALKNSSKLDKKTARIRAGGFAYISIGKRKDKIIVGKEMKALLQEIMPKQKNYLTEIRGVTASPGKTVRGKVRLVLDPRAAGKFKAGEVLVSPETTPDFILAMKQAVAIITDIGGLTSHAAIVSRELKKPCIIATKVATSVLKDGDLVEVDANKGIVKILNKE